MRTGIYFIVIDLSELYRRARAPFIIVARSILTVYHFKERIADILSCSPNATKELFSKQDFRNASVEDIYLLYPIVNFVPVITRHLNGRGGAFESERKPLSMPVHGFWA